jgi:hypothetical protein
VADVDEADVTVPVPSQLPARGKRPPRKERMRIRRSNFISAWAGAIGARNSSDLYRARLARGTAVVSFFFAILAFLVYRLLAPIFGTDDGGLAGHVLLLFLITELTWLGMAAIRIAQFIVMMPRLRRRLFRGLTGSTSHKHSRLDLRTPARFVAWCEKEHLSRGHLGDGVAIVSTFDQTPST